MADQAITSQDPEPPKGRRHKRRTWRRAILSLFGSLFLAACAGVVLFFLVGQSVAVPQWAQARFETRASQAFPGAELTFSGAEVYLQDRWLPRIRLQDVSLSTDDGREIVHFSEVAVNFHFDSLFLAEPLVRDVSLTGVFATVRRGGDGSIAVTSSQDSSAAQQEAANFADLARTIDDALSAPALSGLQSVDIQAVTLRYEDVKSRRAWTIDGGRAQLNRTEDNVTILADLALLSGGQGVATLAANYTSQLGEIASEFGITITDVDAADIAVQGPAFAWLAPLRADISGSLRGGFAADGTLAPLNATLTIGEGVLQPNDVTSPIPFRSARTYFTYDPQAQSLEFTEVSVDSKWISARSEGVALLGEAGDNLVGQFEVSDISFNPADLYPEAMSIQGAAADFRVQFDPFEIDLGQMLVRDQGQSLVIRGNLTAQPDGWAYGFDAQMDSLMPGRLFALWPEGLVTRTRAWLTNNILSGRLNDIDFAIRGAPVVRPNIYASFDYTDASVRFLKTLPPVEEARGHATLVDNRLVVSVDEGYLTAPEGGRLETQDSSFIVPDITVRDGAPGVVRLSLDGPVTAALSVLNLPPMRVMDRAGLPVDLAQGRASAVGSISVPLRQGVTAEDIYWDATGVVRNVETDRLIEGRVLAADALTLTATQAGVSMGGVGTLDGVPFDATWTQELGQSTPGVVEGVVTLSESAVRTFEIGLPPGTVSGQGPGRVRVELPRGAPPRFQLTSTLNGVGLAIPPLGWSLSRGAQGSLEVAGLLGDRPRVDRVALSANGLRAEGSVTLRADGGLDRAAFREVSLSNWLKAPVAIVGRGPGLAPEIRVEGGQIDLRKAEFGSSDASSEDPGPLVLGLNQLQITDSIALTDFQGQFDLRRGLDGRFVARVNGGPTVSGRVLPSNGRSAVRITSKDAGGVIAAAGLLQQARGGDMDLTLIPVGSGGAFDGDMKIANTRVKDAPAMADLLAALSIIGLLEQLSGNGILFSDVEADFRLTPDRLFLRSASAVGPSMGISMDGTYATASRALDMQGVVSPVYVLNAIGSLLTRKGEGLIGFNYRLQGQADAPRVSVNPLSAFTPGMFREIFRRPPPVVPKIENERRSLIPEEFKQDRNAEQGGQKPARRPAGGNR